MKYTRSILLCIFSILCNNYIFSASNLIPVDLGWSKNSVNTAIFRNSSLATYQDYQFVAFYDKEKNVVLGKRKHGTEVWEISITQYKGNANDAHNVISITVDGNGYLHVSWDHHGHPLNYTRSVAPISLELRDKMKMTEVEEDNVTYPEFYKFSNGDLLFAYRSGSSGNGNLVLKKYDIKTGGWNDMNNNLISGENKRNAYWQIYVDNQDNIHVSWVWRETYNVDTNHDLCYAVSRDSGDTWEKSNGEKYNLPITLGNAEYVWRIPQNSELINQTSMAVDDNGVPYIATYWRDPDSGVPQYYILYKSGDVWMRNQVTGRISGFSLSGAGTKKIPISRPRILCFNEEGKANIYFLFRDEERGSKVSMATISDIDKNEWTFEDLTSFTVNSWEPTFDMELWKKEKILNIFVQNTEQGDGESTVEIDPQMIYILEYIK
ncbi:MAG: BNR repeat-containing protein [Rikenellaceae bacterium]|nr:BNR repeat-containing protein [Rikenellaceae bacterium]